VLPVIKRLNYLFKITITTPPHLHYCVPFDREVFDVTLFTSNNTKNQDYAKVSISNMVSHVSAKTPLSLTFFSLVEIMAKIMIFQLQKDASAPLLLLTAFRGLDLNIYPANRRSLSAGAILRQSCVRSLTSGVF